MEFEHQTIAITASKRPLAAALTEAFARQGGTVVPIPRDIAPTAFAQERSRVDVLLLLPDPLPVGPTLEQHDAADEALLGPAVLYSFQLMRALGGGMVARRQGCIITIGSLTASQGWPGWAQPSALHGALLALTRSLAVEWASQGVRVLYLTCAAVEGELTGLNGSSPTLAELAARTPLGRVAQAHEVAQVALYLAGPEASGITGSEIRADGGWSAWGLLK